MEMHVAHKAILRILSLSTVQERGNMLYDGRLDHEFPIMDSYIELKEAGYLFVDEDNYAHLTPIGQLTQIGIPSSFDLLVEAMSDMTPEQAQEYQDKLAEFDND